ncbi:GntR family transcriptional regulator [Marinobacter sp.]|jgi:DNA-binding GntR family transcriptional regulator|uniref:GntR family transcriptional regulator n=1 Tax=Marinobacter sp. TaxID=50741 RepID=UPI001995C41B|nr:GntR family transcriptional regulator [Marinobacter sp.]MBC7193752.1 GntR family transcriptional regulator [Marinobacter sp.]
MEFQAPNTLAEQIANYLAERIMTGQIRPGERIQEATIAAELQVSRASVKEALYTLERWYLVDITPRKGASATRLDETHATELYDVYMHLLIMLARRLCERWKEEDKPRLLKPLEQVVGQINDNRSDIAGVVAASFEVMEKCCEVVGNPYLTESLSNFKPAVSRTYYIGSDRYRQDLDQTGHFFSELTQAVLDRNPEEAEKQVTRFAEHQKALIRRALGQQQAASL